MQRGKQVRKGSATMTEEPGSSNPGPEVGFRSQHSLPRSTERKKDRSRPSGCLCLTGEDEATTSEIIKDHG